MTKINNRETGNKFEQIAMNYLRRKNYKIIDHNFFSKRYGKLDIIAEKDNVIIFVEVKGRKNLKYGSGENAITFRKKQNLIQSSELWVMMNNCQKDWQIDVIAINEKPSKTKNSSQKIFELKHFKNCITL